MKIFFAGLENDHYDPEKGKTFEYNNFYLQLTALNHDLTFIPFDQIITKGKAKFNRDLVSLIKTEKPDLFFSFMYTDELAFETLKEIKRYTTSLAWFADDHWRLETYSRFYAPHFTWNITTWSKAIEKYADYGITNIIRSQWACNSSVYKPIETSKDIDVSFAGMRSTAREKMVRGISKYGLSIFLTGFGWDTPRLKIEELVRLFSRSKINLNLNPPTSSLDLKSLGQICFRKSITKIVPDFRLTKNTRAYLDKKIPQIKARPFEVAGCGGFCISGKADDIENYYVPDKEMVFYNSIEDLVDKIRYYLDHHEERERIALAGYKRTQEEHTYEKRFESIFTKIGLK